MWTRGLRRWYTAHGRHDLPWRLTRDPWPVLVSEVMLQQTSVARVLPRYRAFLERWPTATACAAAPLADLLRFWDGLGYPRRALALQRTAATVSSSGWPADAAGLRGLPGVGPYTAAALQVLAFGRSGPIPRDVNVSRVAARAALGGEPGRVSAADLDAALAAGRPRGLSARDYTLALFDVGALHCRSLPRCQGCPLARSCRRRASAAVAPRRGGSIRYRGSTRQLRGDVLRMLLAPAAPHTLSDLQRRLAGAGWTPEQVGAAAAGLQRDGLCPDRLALGSTPSGERHP